MIKATKLLRWNRWDIIAKHYYAYLYNIYSGKPPKWIIDLYEDHINVLNGGIEKTTQFQLQTKYTSKQFLADFNALIDNITVNGFNTEHPIPLSKNDAILNGGHRIAISANYNLKIPTTNIDEYAIVEFKSECFQDRKKHQKFLPSAGQDVKNNLEVWQNDLIALNLLTIKSNFRICIFFDNINYEKLTSQIKSYFHETKVSVVYTKTIKLSPSGIYKLTQHLYCNDSFVNVNWKTNQIYKITPDTKIFRSTVVIIHSDTPTILDKYSKSGGKYKTRLRDILGNHHQVHITDNDDDTMIVGRLLLHQPSINFINNASINTYDQINEQLESYKQQINALYKSYNKEKQEKENMNQILNKKQFQDLFAITSSYVLGLYGIRKNNDIDFVYSNYTLSRELDDQLKPLSHNPYLEYYPDTINNMIYDPKNYFYYMGVKCLNLDIILKMKQKRNEIPKDINDVKLIQNFQKFSSLKHDVTIITTTHIIPSAPSTDIIQQMLESLHRYVEGSRYVKHLIFVDMKLTKKQNKVSKKYIKNLEALGKIYPNIYIIPIPNSGLKANYINGIKLCKTPYLYFIEHDWIFLENIPTSRFVEIMNQHNDVNYIKMSKRNNMEIGGWDKMLFKDERFNDIVKVNAWTNHPHIVRLKKWKDTWLKIINPNTKAEKSDGVEEVMYKQYHREAITNGLDITINRWGCYNWLSNTGNSPINHLDGSLNYTGEEIAGHPNN